MKPAPAGPPPESCAGGGAFRASELRSLPAGNDEYLIDRRGARAEILSRFEAECLARCATYRSLGEQARAIAEEFGADLESAAEIRAVLESAAAKGLVAPFEDLFAGAGVAATGGAAEAGGPSEPSPAVRAESLGFVTADRPDAALRGLATYMDNARAHGREIEWVVHDDSADTATRAAYRDALDRLAAERGVALSYGGEEEKRLFASALVRRGLSPEVVEFCLFGAPGYGPRYGANLNARLLDLAGRAGLCCDDDTLCDMGMPPGASPAPAMASGDATVFGFFAAPQEARDSLNRSDEDYIGLHESLLGRSLRACVSGPPRLLPRDADRASDGLLRLTASGRGRVVATQAGIAGDSGMGSTFYYLTLEGSSRESLMAAACGVGAALDGRAVVRAVPNPTVDDSPSFMTYAVGFDCRGLLPPFLPNLRNSDGLFARLMPLVRPDAAFGLLPRTVGHVPPEARRSDRVMRQNVAAGLGCADLIAHLGRSFPADCLGRGAAGDRLRALGAFYAGLGGMPAPELEELVIGIYRREKAKLLYSLAESEGRAEGESAVFREEIRAAIDALRPALTASRPGIHSEMGGSDQEGRLAAFGALLRRYGGLLAAWPDIVGCALELREEGLRLAAPL